MKTSPPDVPQDLRGNLTPEEIVLAVCPNRNISLVDLVGLVIVTIFGVKFKSHMDEMRGGHKKHVKLGSVTQQGGGGSGQTPPHPPPQTQPVF